MTTWSSSGRATWNGVVEALQEMMENPARRAAAAQRLRDSPAFRKLVEALSPPR